jgi:acyl-CoA synthetase (AMP-forming)/AMP-acid ligase II
MILQCGDRGRNGTVSMPLITAGDYPSDRLHAGRDRPDDIAVYFHSRDTTGTPSLVPVTHGNLVNVAWTLGLVTTLAPEEVLLYGLWRFMQGWWPAVGS